MAFCSFGGNLQTREDFKPSSKQYISPSINPSAALCLLWLTSNFCQWISRKEPLLQFALTMRNAKKSWRQLMMSSIYVWKRSKVSTSNTSKKWWSFWGTRSSGSPIMLTFFPSNRRWRHSSPTVGDSRSTCWNDKLHLYGIGISMCSVIKADNISTSSWSRFISSKRDKGGGEIYNATTARLLPITW